MLLLIFNLRNVYPFLWYKIRMELALETIKYIFSFTEAIFLA